MAFLRTSQDRAAFVILVLMAAVTVALWPFASGLLGAGALYVAFAPLYHRLVQRLPAGGSAAVAVLAAAVALTVPLVWIAGLVIADAPGALQSVYRSAPFARLAGRRLGGIDVGSQLAGAGMSLASWLSSQLMNVAGSVAASTLNLTISLLGLYYLLRGGAQTWTQARQYIPFTPEASEALRERFVAVTQATLLGIGLVAVIQGVLIGIGFAIVRLPDPLFWGAVSAVASMIPVVGATLVWLPAALVLLAHGRPGAALAMAVIGGGIAGNVAELVRPLVYRKKSDIHPMVTLVGTFAGVRYFGPLGLVLGPLAIVYVFELLRVYRQEYETIRAEDAIYGPSRPRAGSLEVARPAPPG